MIDPGFTGRIDDLSISDYHAAPHLSASGVSDILKSPAHYRKKVWHDSKAKRIGSAVHLLLLEPEKAAKLLPQAPGVNKRTKAGREEFAAWEASLPSEALRLASDERELADRCATAIREHPFTQNLAFLCPQRSQREVSLFFTVETEEGPCHMRARPDSIVPGLACLFDIKTAMDLEPNTLRRHAEGYGWHRQAALYTRAAAALGIELRDERMVFVAVEKSEPFAVRFVAYDDDALELGDRDIMRAATIWARCNRTGEWPSYPNQIDTLHLSPWMIDSE